jgi:peptidoglycan hydrolase CwlO-like protein
LNLTGKSIFSIVPVLDGIMKVNGFFCNKTMSELAEASKAVEAAMKNLQSVSDELNDLRSKQDDARVNIESMKSEIKDLEDNIAYMKKHDENTQRVSLDLGKKRKEDIPAPNFK